VARQGQAFVTWVRRSAQPVWTVTDTRLRNNSAQMALECLWPGYADAPNPLA
jgi:hypothetical protein